MTIKSQDDLNQPEKHSTEVLVAAIEKCKKLEKENNTLKEAIDLLGGLKCPKCGEYYHRNYICWSCGYDHTIPEELDK